ncbi:4-hydroxythreonine-4-phosphate dehydrogenase [Cutibacterium acnes JCM 18920]|nr:4-hydroxythreonine-4-phosphate dehydrogenase [Cutibacterium acnes JCM 18920]
MINVVDTGTVPHADSIEWGSVQELAGRAAIASIEAATDAHFRERPTALSPPRSTRKLYGRLAPSS